jgi:hypothetical protein
MAKRFNGVIKLDVRDSTPDWEPFILKKAPAGAPNVPIVLYDDTGLAAWSPFGGAINMPTLQKLADRGLKPEQKFVSGELAPGKYTLGMEFTREKSGQHGESHGTTTLYVNDKAVAQGAMRTQAGKFTLSGDGLCIGRDSGDAVSEDYKTPGEFQGGTILFVGVTVEKAQYLELEKLAAAALAVDRCVHSARSRHAGAGCCESA